MRTLGTRLPSSSSRLGCLTLFAVPITVIGSYVAFLTLRTLVLLTMMQSWTVVPATLRNVELVASGQSSQYVRASYDYVFQGQPYTGRRVSLYGADNLGSFHEDTYRELHDHLARNQPYPLHVNPKAPSESILKPVLRPEAIGFYLVFVILFGAVGWSILISSCLKMIKARKEARLMDQFPDQPWKHRVEWAEGRIKSTQGMDALMETSLAVFWNVATFPILLIVPRELSAGNRVALAFLAIPLVGVGLAFWALVAILRAKRFGAAYLQLKSMPGRPGEAFQGRIYAPKSLEQASSVALTLRCEANTATTATRSADLQELWRWDSAAPVIREQGPNGEAVIEVACEIPAGLPDSQRGLGDQYRWLLSASAPLRGADFSMEIEVPVFSR